MSRERFLERIAVEADKTLSSCEIEVLVAHARAHIEDSIQARIELGDAPEVAERQALAAFGTPKDVLRAANAVHRARFQGLFLGLATAGGLGWTFSLLASPVLPRVDVVVPGIAFFSMFAAFVRASEVRRAWEPVLVAGVTFWLALTAICAAWMRDYSFEGWLAPRFEGPLSPFRAACWSGVATLVFFAYLALAYRMARPSPTKRGLRE